MQKRSLTASGTPPSGASAAAATGASSATHVKAFSSSAAARDRYAALLPDFERVFGPDHPSTLDVYAKRLIADGASLVCKVESTI